MSGILIPSPSVIIFPLCVLHPSFNYPILSLTQKHFPHSQLLTSSSLILLNSVRAAALEVSKQTQLELFNSSSLGTESLEPDTPSQLLAVTEPSMSVCAGFAGCSQPLMLAWPSLVSWACWTRVSQQRRLSNLLIKIYFLVTQVLPTVGTNGDMLYVCICTYV